MTKTIQTVIGVAVLVVGFILGSLSGYKASPSPVALGATAYDRLDQVGEFTQGLDRSFSLKDGDLRVGTTTGAYISKMLVGTCNLVGDVSDTIGASARVQASCVAPGVRAGDKVFVTLATSTIPGVGAPVIAGASASTTSNYIGVTLLNASTTATQVTRIGTSTQYWVLR